MEKIGAPLFFRKLRKLTPPPPFKKVVGGSNDEVVKTVLQKSISFAFFFEVNYEFVIIEN